MTLGAITPNMRLWCRRLYNGARWYRVREYSHKTHCDKHATPSYDIVERMRDAGLVVFVRGDVTKGCVWEAKLTELGRVIGAKLPNADVRRRTARGESLE